MACADVVVHDVDLAFGKRIEEAVLFAKLDPYRAATHNKGIFNGIDPILIATGNDWRAVEAGAHAARSGRYMTLSDWKMQGSDLLSHIELPMAVGTVGGVTRLHPTAAIALRLLGIEKVEGLARICAAVGLVQNLGALKALVTDGVVEGHMQLHASNIALAAGAENQEVDQVKLRFNGSLKSDRPLTSDWVRQILSEIRSEHGVLDE